MSIVPNIESEDRDDLCLECGRDVSECACGETLPDDFDPLGEADWEEEWGHIFHDYDEYLDNEGAKQ